MKKLLTILVVFIFVTNVLGAHAIGPNSFDKTIKSHKLVLVKFWASWCGPCRILKPEFEKAKRVAGKYVYFAEYNVDLRGAPLRKYNVQTIPTLILFENGKEVDRNSILGAQDIIDWVMGYVPR